MSAGTAPPGEGGYDQRLGDGAMSNATQSPAGTTHELTLEVRIRQAYDAFNDGDLKPMLDLYDKDDSVWHLPPGDCHPLGGDWRGRDQIRALLDDVYAAWNNTLHLDVHDVLVNDRHAVVLVLETGYLAGEYNEESVAHLLHIKDGRLTEFFVARHVSHPYHGILRH
jgi:ketosteroid isomerase-like protein